MNKTLAVSEMTREINAVGIHQGQDGATCEGCVANTVIQAATLRSRNQFQEMVQIGNDMCADLRASHHCQKGPNKER